MFERTWVSIVKIFKDIRFDSVLFDGVLILYSYYFIYGYVADSSRIIDMLNPFSGFILVVLMQVLLPVYAVYLYKRQITAKPGLKKYLDESWSGCIVSFSIIFLIYLPAVMLLPFLGVFIGIKAGLFHSYSIGVPFAISGIITTLIGVYLARLQIRTDDFEMLVGNFHEESIKKALDKLNGPIVEFILPFIILPLVFMWLEILLEGLGEGSNAGALILWLTLSGYLPMRVLIELEPPLTPLNIATGLGSIGFFLYASLTMP